MDDPKNIESSIMLSLYKLNFIKKTGFKEQ
jgi:hypothetical protein